jgi:hypothetical protein
MKIDDNQCFKWCVTRALNPVEVHPERISNLLREQSKQLDWSGIEFPVTFKDNAKFEVKNNIVVNFFGSKDETGVIHPLKQAKLEGKVTNLLLYKEH